MEPGPLRGLRARARSLSAISLSAILAVVSLSGHATAQSVVRVTGEPTCSSCSIELTTLVRLGGEDGPGAIEWLGGVAFPAFDSQGRIYLRGQFATEIKVYSASGEYLATIGREGEGPGEFEGVMGIAVGPADSLYAFDVLSMRMSVFSPRREFVRSARIETRPAGFDPLMVPWDPGHFYLTSRVRTPDLVGLPIHRLNKLGERVHSFGAAQALYSPTEPYSGLRIIADAGNGALWAGRMSRYQIERVSPNTPDPLTRIQRDVDWFPTPEPRDRTGEHARGGRAPEPTPLLMDLFQDEGRLWVLLWLPDPHWEKARSDLGDEWRRYDTLIEVLDLPTGRVVARSRFSDLYRDFLGPGLVGGTIYEGGLVPVYHIKRMEIVQR